jgi:hypothetical protein
VLRVATFEYRALISVFVQVAGCHVNVGASPNRVIVFDVGQCVVARMDV